MVIAQLLLGLLYHQALELHKSIGILLMMGWLFVLWCHIRWSAAELFVSAIRLAAKADISHCNLLLFAIGISVISTADGKLTAFGRFDVPAILLTLAHRLIFAGAPFCPRERCSTVRCDGFMAPASFHR